MFKRSGPVGQKFQIGDRVFKRGTGSHINPPRTDYGHVVEVIIEKDRRGHKQHYYVIKFDDRKTSKHSQHRLNFATT